MGLEVQKAFRLLFLSSVFVSAKRILSGYTSRDTQKKKNNIKTLEVDA